MILFCINMPVLLYYFPLNLLLDHTPQDAAL